MLSVDCPPRPAVVAYFPLESDRLLFANISPATPATSPSALLSHQLDEVLAECHAKGWDGYEAEGIGAHAYFAAKAFIKCLPYGFPLPSLSADLDGCITFEWRAAPRRIFLVSVHPSFRIDYAAVLGEAKLHGTELFHGRLPDAVRLLAHRVYAA